MSNFTTPANGEIALVFGTSAGALRLASVASALQEKGAPDFYIVSTGEQGESLKETTDRFAWSIDYSFPISTGPVHEEVLTGALLEQIGAVFRERRPASVVVAGSTLTAFCAALAAYYQSIPVIHVHSRHGRGNQVQRVLIDAIARLHFVPDEVSSANLIADRVDPRSICIEEDPARDSFLRIASEIRGDRSLAPGVPPESDCWAVVTCDLDEQSTDDREVIDGLRALLIRYEGRLSLAVPRALDGQSRIPSSLRTIGGVHDVPALEHHVLLAFAARPGFFLTATPGSRQLAALTSEDLLERLLCRSEPGLGVDTLVPRESAAIQRATTPWIDAALATDATASVPWPGARGVAVADRIVASVTASESVLNRG